LEIRILNRERERERIWGIWDLKESKESEIVVSNRERERERERDA